MMKILMPYIHQRQSVAVVIVVMAESFEGSFSLDDFEASAIESAAAVPNLDNITTCSCRGYCLREKGRNYCPCKSINNFCSSACHEGDFELCMNNRRVQDTDSDDTVRLFSSLIKLRVKLNEYL